MSVYLYDEALVDRLKKVTGDSRIHIVHPDQAFSFLAQFDKDKVQLPAIVLSRGPVSMTNTRNQYAALKGQTVRINKDDNSATKMKLVPLRIEWSLDVYAADRYTCDEIIREIVMYFITYPRFLVKVPYDIDVDQNFDVFIGDDISDNTDLIDFPNTGEIFRETITLYTENAHFYASSRHYLTGFRFQSEIDDKL